MTSFIGMANLVSEIHHRCSLLTMEKCGTSGETKASPIDQTQLISYMINASYNSVNYSTNQ